MKAFATAKERSISDAFRPLVESTRALIDTGRRTDRKKLRADKNRNFSPQTALAIGDTGTSRFLFISKKLVSLAAIGICLLWAIALVSCGRSPDSEPEAKKSDATPKSPQDSLEITFTYGSEKKAWIEEATAAFNAKKTALKSGRELHVNAIPMGSGDCIDELLNGGREADITSPASAAFIKLGNAESRVKTGHDLIGETQNLVLSPVVIAMWKPMAEAIGWGKKPVGWSDILALAEDPRGWASVGNPQWGPFRFGHTHPESSNSGLISLMAEVYAGARKVRGLTLEDLARPEVGAYLGGIEQSVVHYGSSTGFFGDKLVANGPGYLSAAVLYESVVIDSYTKNSVQPLVAVYPKEGTFWSDHPVGIVQKAWVTPERQEGAKLYIDYLLSRPVQEKALNYGFRPSLPEIALGPPFDFAHGVDPKEPKTVLEEPSAEILNATLSLWKAKKKTSSVTLVIDTSGSMDEDQKIQNAKAGALEFLDLLGDADTFSLIPFNSRIFATSKNMLLKDSRQLCKQSVEALYASGGTALYDAISLAYDQLMGDRALNEKKITAIVVLTDGADTDSKMSLADLISRIKFDNETHTIRVFTIAYGHDANQTILKQIADATQAKSYLGTPQNIRSVFKDISTFF
jgi:Ca-activated chloride channel homolog